METSITYGEYSEWLMYFRETGVIEDKQTGLDENKLLVGLKGLG